MRKKFQFMYQQKGNYFYRLSWNLENFMKKFSNELPSLKLSYLCASLAHQCSQVTIFFHFEYSQICLKMANYGAAIRNFEKTELAHLPHFPWFAYLHLSVYFLNLLKLNMRFKRKIIVLHYLHISYFDFVCCNEHI